MKDSPVAATRLGTGRLDPPNATTTGYALPRATPIPARSGPGPFRPSTRGCARRRSPLASLAKLQPSFIADIVSELRKVTWPSFAETRYLTTVVAIVAGIMGLFLGGLDLAFGWAIEKLFF